MTCSNGFFELALSFANGHRAETDDHDPVGQGFSFGLLQSLIQRLGQSMQRRHYSFDFLAGQTDQFVNLLFENFELRIGESQVRQKCSHFICSHFLSYRPQRGVKVRNESVKGSLVVSQGVT
jgi:hypothetical protein